MIFYEDSFYVGLDDLIRGKEMEDVIQDLPDDYELIAYECELQPLFDASLDNMLEMICDCNEERFSEDDDDYDRQRKKIKEAILESVDFEKMKSLVPKLYYPTRNKIGFYKEDFLEEFENMDL